jgi:hypothetical protein
VASRVQEHPGGKHLVSSGFRQSRVYAPTIARLLAVLVLGALVMIARSARADPPAMKEEAAQPTFEITSEDEQNSLAVGGFAQVRAQTFVPAEPTDLPTLGLPRTRLYVFGRVHRQFRYRLMIGTPPYQERLTLFDAYGEWAPNAPFRLRVGRFKIPVMRGWIESGRELAAIDRAPAVLELLPGRAVGAMAAWQGVGDRLELAVGAFDRRGDPALAADVDPSAVAARALWNVHGRPIEGELDFDDSPFTLALGASGMSSFPTGSRETRAERIAGADLAMRARGFDAVAEVMLRDRPGPAGHDRALGAYGRAHYYVQPIHSAFGFRSSTLLGLDDPSQTHHQLELDMAWLPQRHDVKVIGAVLARRTTTPARWSPGVALQLQVAF